MKKPKIAIFGSTSHIAKGLINNFLQSREFSLHLYTRSPNKVRSFLSVLGKYRNNDSVIHEGYNDFLKETYYVLIINCVGVGTVNKLKGDFSKYFTVTEEYDNLVIRYLCNNCPNTLYISFSSGAIYGKKFSAPVDENAKNSIKVNHILPEDYYAIARLNAEAKHRSFKALNIVDLRLFSYFSRFIDLSDGYFITEVMNAILNKKTLIIDKANIIRDYVHPYDVFSAVKKCISTHRLNDAFDINSAKPVEKKEILDYFASEYGLKYKLGSSLTHATATGKKNVYCSNCKKAQEIGYKPKYSSMETIKQESRYILDFQHGLSK